MQSNCCNIPNNYTTECSDTMRGQPILVGLEEIENFYIDHLRYQGRGIIIDPAIDIIKNEFLKKQTMAPTLPSPDRVIFPTNPTACDLANEAKRMASPYKSGGFKQSNYTPPKKKRKKK